MTYITREDGERFVIPSYRDVISAKKQSLLKKEILLLSANYGEYITLHRKNIEQYEVAFSPDTGYLLGETVWHYFKRPLDLIYCEAIPNTTEAILVIVKSGSVYLDGSFAIDSIPDELIIFKTQQNNFDIYIYGDVPISSTLEENKFSFDPSSVRSFQVLEEPVFPKLPKVKNFQLQLVDTVLKKQGIGVFPVKKIVIVLAILGVIWLLWTWTTTHRKEVPRVFVSYVNPYQVYLEALTSPDPVNEIKNIYDKIQLLYTIPGWFPDSMTYSKGRYHASVKSSGAKSAILFDWAKKMGATIQILPDGFYVNWTTLFRNRPMPQTIYKLNDVISSIVDNLQDITPGNTLQIAPIIDRKAYLETNITISFNNVTLDTFLLLGNQLKNLPLVITRSSITMVDGNLSGTITLQALGN